MGWVWVWVRVRVRGALARELPLRALECGADLERCLGGGARLGLDVEQPVGLLALRRLLALLVRVTVRVRVRARARVRVRVRPPRAPCAR